VTTEGTPEMRQKVKDAGADFLIAKPFTADAIKEAIG
jgi:two-component system chemotaxis response regulator CheY